MLKLIACLVLFASVNTYAQSLIVLRNGKVITLDSSGAIQDLGNFMLPYKIKHIGGRFLINDKRKVFTVDERGYFYSKEQEDKVVQNIEHVGENYFISKRGTIFSVDRAGTLYEIKRDKEYKNLVHSCGTFFVSEYRNSEFKKEKALFVVTELGTVVRAAIDASVIDRINYCGGRYFTTVGGTLYTVSTDGYVYAKEDRFQGYELKRGSNYFITRDGIFTVANSGILQSAGNTPGNITHFGANFMITQEGKLYTVSESGALRVSELGFLIPEISHFSRP